MGETNQPCKLYQWTGEARLPRCWHVKKSTCQRIHLPSTCGRRHKRPRLDPWGGKILGGGMQPTQYSPGKSHEQRGGAWQALVHRSQRLNTTGATELLAHLGKPHACLYNVLSTLTPTSVSVVRRWKGESILWGRCKKPGVTLAAHYSL